VLKVKRASPEKTMRSYGFQRGLKLLSNPRPHPDVRPVTVACSQSLTAHQSCSNTRRQPSACHPTTAKPSAPPCLLLSKYRTWCVTMGPAQRNSDNPRVWILCIWVLKHRGIVICERHYSVGQYYLPMNTVYDTVAIDLFIHL
jgi:hypothetical protein